MKKRMPWDVDGPIGPPQAQPFASKEIETELIRTLAAAKDLLDRAALAAGVTVGEDHSTHGRGTPEDGPDDPDCGCRMSARQSACAKAGCGFCGVSERRQLLVHPPLPAVNYSQPAACHCGAVEKATSAMYCDHANEMPSTCPCESNCYCKFYSCRSQLRNALNPPHVCGSKEQTSQRKIPMTAAQRTALFKLLANAFITLRGTMYNQPSRQHVTFVSNLGRALHNVPTWLEEGMISKDDYEWVMKQERERYGML